MRDGSPGRVATNAICRPSGEIATCAVWAFGDGDHVVSLGAATSSLMTPALEDSADVVTSFGRDAMKEAAAAPRIIEPTAVAIHRQRRWLRAVCAAS